MRWSTPAAPSARSPVEGRLTLCNLSIELGAKIGMVAPDDTTFDYLAGRPFAPKGALWDEALAHWRRLPSRRRRRLRSRGRDRCRRRSRRRSPGAPAPSRSSRSMAAFPTPRRSPIPESAARREAALDYMGLAPGAPIAGTPVDWVFIGSCTNSRISDLARRRRGRAPRQGRGRRPRLGRAGLGGA